MLVDLPGGTFTMGSDRHYPEEAPTHGVRVDAFSIDATLAEAALVLVIMNLVMIFPLWPGNVGLLQAAVAAALLSYGVSYAHGILFGIGL